MSNRCAFNIVVKLLEQDQAGSLKRKGLLSLAMLCRTESGEKPLHDAAARINHIQSRGDVRRSTGREASRACVMI
jgi:hypothetical protein